MIDSGAIYHLSGDRLILSDIRSLLTPIIFETTNEEQVTAHSVGSVISIAHSGKMFVVNDRDRRINILSLDTLLQRGWEVDFKSNDIQGIGGYFKMKRIHGLWTVLIPRQPKQHGAALAVPEGRKDA